MSPNPTNSLSHDDLSDIRDAVPTLDLFAIRSLRRAGFQIVRQDLNGVQESSGSAPQAAQSEVWVAQANHKAS